MAEPVKIAAQFSKASMDCQALADGLKEKFGEDILSLEVHERKAGKNNETASRDMWVEIPLASFRPFVEHLFSYDFVNFHIISGDDIGDEVLLRYHLSVFQRNSGARIGVTAMVKIPKSELVIPSIFDLLPGSEYSEREIREMFGVDFDGLPNKGLVFLPEDWNEQIKPWRRDDQGPSPEMIRELN